MQSTLCAFKNCPNHIPSSPSSPINKKHPCAYCNQTYYCSITCRILDWESSHRKTCINAPPVTSPELKFEPKPISTTSVSIVPGSSKSLQDYELISLNNKGMPDVLGKGAFGQVKLVKDKADPTKLFALKILNKKHLQMHSGVEFLKREIKIQGSLSHPHIITLHHAFEDNESVYLVLEYAEKGNLFYYLRKKRKLQEKEAFVFFFQTCVGIDYLHKKGILHRDLKPENLLLDKKDNIKLCDFGYSAEDIGKRNTFCGTVDYMAPEVVLKRDQTSKVDIWSLGVLLFELLHGFPPFKGFTNEEKFKSIVSNQIQCEGISEEAKDLIRRLVRSEPTLRPTFEEIFEHPWMRKFETEFKLNMKSFLHQSPKKENRDKSPASPYNGQVNPFMHAQEQFNTSPQKGSPLKIPSFEKALPGKDDREKSQDRKNKIFHTLSQSPNNGTNFQPKSPIKITGSDFAGKSIEDIKSPKFGEENKQEKDKLNRSYSASKLKSPTSKTNGMKPESRDYSQENFELDTEEDQPRSSRGRLEMVNNGKHVSEPTMGINRTRILQDLYENERRGDNAHKNQSPSKNINDLGINGEKSKRKFGRFNRRHVNLESNRQELLSSYRDKIASLYDLNGNTNDNTSHIEQQISSNYNSQKSKNASRGAKTARELGSSFIRSITEEEEHSPEMVENNRKGHRKHYSESKQRVSKYVSRDKSKSQRKKETLTAINEDIDLEDARVSRLSYKNTREIYRPKEKPKSDMGFFSKLALLCGCVNRNDNKESKY